MEYTFEDQARDRYNMQAQQGPTGEFVSSAPAGGVQAEIARRQQMRLDPSIGNPFQISPQNRADILGMQVSNGAQRNGKLMHQPMLPNNGRPVGHEFANGLQMNSIMGGPMKYAPRQQLMPNQPQQQMNHQIMQQLQSMFSGRMQGGQQQPQQMIPQGPNTGTSAWNRAFETANFIPHKTKDNQDALTEYYKKVLLTKPQYTQPEMSGSGQIQQMQPMQQMQHMQQLITQMQQNQGQMQQSGSKQINPAILQILMQMQQNQGGSPQAGDSYIMGR